MCILSRIYFPINIVMIIRKVNLVKIIAVNDKTRFPRGCARIIPHHLYVRWIMMCLEWQGSQSIPILDCSFLIFCDCVTTATKTLMRRVIIVMRMHILSAEYLVSAPTHAKCRFFTKWVV